jgi:hypothetical protein
MAASSSRRTHTARGLFRLIADFFDSLNSRVITLNQSKIFAGLVIIILNVSGKFANIKLSKTMESYLKYTFSRNILVFSMAWMGTRDIYTALGMTLLFILLSQYLLNEESPYCCLPEQFTDYHTSVADENKPQVTEQELDDAIKILVKLKDKSTLDSKSNDKSSELWSSAN